MTGCLEGDEFRHLALPRLVNLNDLARTTHHRRCKTTIAHRGRDLHMAPYWGECRAGRIASSRQRTRNILQVMR
jgi:hypothetical protein